MDYYFINPSNEQVGPLSLSQLAESGITGDTLVWHEGMSAWTKAGDIQEVAIVLQGGSAVAPDAPEANMPPVPESREGIDYIPDAPVCAIGKAVWGLVLGTLAWFYPLLIVAPFGILGIVFNVVAYNWYKKGNYELATRFERKAHTFARVALILGIVFFVVIWSIVCLAGMKALDELDEFNRHSFYY